LKQRAAEYVDPEYLCEREEERACRPFNYVYRPTIYDNKEELDV